MEMSKYVHLHFMNSNILDRRPDLFLDFPRFRFVLRLRFRAVFRVSGSHRPLLSLLNLHFAIALCFLSTTGIQNVFK